MFYWQQCSTWVADMDRLCLQRELPEVGCYCLGASNCDHYKWSYRVTNNPCVISNTKLLHALNNLWCVWFFCIVWILYGAFHRATCWDWKCPGSHLLLWFWLHHSICWVLLSKAAALPESRIWQRLLCVIIRLSVSHKRLDLHLPPAIHRCLLSCHLLAWMWQ